MPDQYNQLVGHPLKYPYLVGITTESGNLGTGILISTRFVLTCGHVLDDSPSAEVVSREGKASAQVQKVDHSLDLALLELTQPISASKPKFAGVPLRPSSVVLAVGVQETPGKSDELSIAEIELKFRNQNVADGKILDIQLDGGARPGYSGGPVLVKKGGDFLCIGILRSGGAGANTSNAVGLAQIRAFVEEYVPDMPEAKLSTNASGIRRLLIVTAILIGVVVVGAVAKWLNPPSHNPKVISNPGIVSTQEPERNASAEPTPIKKIPASFSPGPGARLNPVPPQSIAETTESTQGKPDLKVWVNTASNVYHCAGTRFYGKTKHGEYMTQAEAQKKANRPAYGKVCK